MKKLSKFYYMNNSKCGPFLGLILGIWSLSVTSAAGLDQVLFPQQAKLTASDRGLLGDSGHLWSRRFGESVSVSGDRLVVGSRSGGLIRTYDAQRAGLVYVYARAGDSWIEENRLVASDRTLSDGFGGSVSVSGDTFVVGADGANPDDLNNAGTAYVYVREGTSWVEQAKLTASDKAAGDHFGWAVSISGDTVVVGAHSTSSSSTRKAAYVYVRNGINWVEQAKLTASNKESSGNFGTSVSVSGDTVIVGAPWAEAGGLERSGAAYVYVRNGGNWVEQTKLIARDNFLSSHFGESVSISGNTLVVGAGGAVDKAWGNTFGAAYVYDRKDGVWVEQAKLTASDKETSRQHSLMGSVQFGSSVSISGEKVVVGAPTADPDGLIQAGAAYVFARSGTTWFEQGKLTATEKSESDHFGTSVSISGDTVVAGALDDKVDVTSFFQDSAGAAYIFTGFGEVSSGGSATGSQPKIAFIAIEDYSTPEGIAQIYVMEFDGTNRRNVSNSAGNNTHPSWSPNGSKIAFVSDRDGNREIYIMDAEGTNVNRLTNDLAEDSFPAFSPDGHRIAFTSSRDGNLEIYAMDVNGSNLVRLTSEPGEDNMPFWSPDGRTIIFSYGLGDSREIYAMDADGSNRTQLTSNNAADMGPAYSPDGTKIVFNTNRDGNNEVYVMDSDGSNQINLTNNPNNDGVSSRWTPDGSQILFWSRRQGANVDDVYLMNADGSNQINLTQNISSDDQYATATAARLIIVGAPTLVVPSSTDPAIVNFNWSQTESDPSTGSGRLWTKVNGIDLSAPMPPPTLNQKESTEVTIPAGVVGFAIKAYSGPGASANEGPKPGSPNGFHLGWSGTVTLSGSIEDAYDPNTTTCNAGQINEYLLDVKLIYEAGDLYHYTADVFDDPSPSGGINILGKHRFAGWIGDDGEGARHSGNDNQDYGSGKDAFAIEGGSGLIGGAQFDFKGGALGENAMGDNVGITLALRDGSDLGPIFVSNLVFSGTLQQSGLLSSTFHDAIAINFGADEPDGARSDVNGVAGALGTSTWINLEGASGSAVVNGTDTVSDVSVTWTSSNTWATHGRILETNNTAPVGNDRNLMTGYLDTNETDPISVMVNNIPFESYHVYVYIKGGVVGRGGDYAIAGNTQSHIDTAAFSGDYIEGAEGDYLVFEGVSGSSFTLTGQPTTGTPRRAAINAIEVVDLKRIVRDKFQLTTQAEGGRIERSPDLAEYSSGTTVNLTAVPNPGFQFDGWKGLFVGRTNPLDLVMTQDWEVEALFVADSQHPLEEPEGSQEVTFADSRIESAVRERLDLEEGDLITVDALAGLTDIGLLLWFATGPLDLDGLQHAKNLNKITTAILPGDVEIIIPAGLRISLLDNEFGESIFRWPSSLDISEVDFGDSMALGLTFYNEPDSPVSDPSLEYIIRSELNLWSRPLRSEDLLSIEILDLSASAPSKVHFKQWWLEEIRSRLNIEDRPVYPNDLVVFEKLFDELPFQEPPSWLEDLKLNIKRQLEWSLPFSELISAAVEVGKLARLPDGLGGLRTLNLTGHGLSEIALPDGLENLQNLILSHNQLSSLDLPSLPSIQRLELVSNNFEFLVIPDEILELQHLDVSLNPIKCIDTAVVLTVDELVGLSHGSVGNFSVREFGEFTPVETLDPNLRFDNPFYPLKVGDRREYHGFGDFDGDFYIEDVVSLELVEGIPVMGVQFSGQARIPFSDLSGVNYYGQDDGGNIWKFEIERSDDDGTVPRIVSRSIEFPSLSFQNCHPTGAKIVGHHKVDLSLTFQPGILRNVRTVGGFSSVQGLALSFSESKRFYKEGVGLVRADYWAQPAWGYSLGGLELVNISDFVEVEIVDDGFPSIPGELVDTPGLQMIGSRTVWIDDQMPVTDRANMRIMGAGTWEFLSRPLEVEPALGQSSLVVDADDISTRLEFVNAVPRMSIDENAILVADVYLSPFDPPNAFALSWSRGNGGNPGVEWTLDGVHEFYPWGFLSFDSRDRRPLPETGKWVRLEIPASSLGIQNTDITGFAIVVDDGVMAFDGIGVINPPELQQPNIISQPQSTTVATGDSLTLSVEVEGGGDFSYQWAHNGKEIPGANTAFLELDNLQVTDAGAYNVVVSNAAGSVVSSMGILQVTAPAEELPPTVINSISVLPNGSVRMLFSNPSLSQIQVEVSNDLVSWQRVGVIDLVDGKAEYVDSAESGAPIQFYRFVNLD
ncbi:DUF5050 domain-containing protein [bacterium]|nr:DUF5050 domain-containing protein [bacterium]